MNFWEWLLCVLIGTSIAAVFNLTVEKTITSDGWKIVAEVVAVVVILIFVAIAFKMNGGYI